MTPESEQNDALILALANGASWRHAAKQVGFSHSTVARRMKDPAFRKLVSDQRAALVQEAAGRITSLMKRAAKTLQALLNSKSDAIRLGACRLVLESAVSLRQLTEFEERLAQLEGTAK